MNSPITPHSQSSHAIEPRDHDQQPGLLPILNHEDVLPELGGWSRQVGRRVVATTAASALALAIWPWQQTVQTNGVVRPAGENTLVQSSLDGSVATVWVQENQHVRRGERLAELDCSAIAFCSTVVPWPPVL